MNQVLRERWPEVKGLFEAASAQPRAGRSAWLDAQPVDPALRAAVAVMLADAEDDTLDDVAPESAVAAVATGPAPGTVLGRYRIVRPIGRGGMGVVYLAEQSNPHRLVALKQLAGSAGSAALARFRREADLLARLSHPGIARIIEVDEDAEGNPLLVMEYVDGRDLASYVVDRPRPERLALLVHIADAVEHAHARGVVHRDLKPANILVDADGLPRVLDFGIGHVMGEGQTLTETGMLLGTPAYMSPEQAAGTARVDARSDVYALGVIAYELIANRLPMPVAGLTPLEALRVVGEATPPPLSRIDSALDDDLAIIVETALAKEPRLRYPSAGAFADDLRRYLAREPIRARRPGLWRRAALYARRKPAQVAALGLALLGIVGGSLLALGFAWTAAQERDRAEAAAIEARGTQQALARVFSAGNPAIAGRPDVPFRDVLRAAPEQLKDMPDPIRLPVQYTVALAQAQVGDDLAAIEGFAAAAALATSLGQPEARAQAELRRIMVALEYMPIETSAAAIEALLADPAVTGHPLLHAGTLVWSTRIAAYQFRSRFADTRLQAARAAWRTVGAAAPPLDDATLATEIEIDLLWLELGALMSGFGTAPDAGKLVSTLQSAHARLGQRIPADHPGIAAIRVAAENIEDALAGRSPWRARLREQIEEQVPRFGLAHPTLMAQVRMGGMLAALQQIQDPELQVLQIAIARALPEGSRRRLRLLMEALERGGHSPRLGVTVAEVAATRAQVCPDPTAVDMDCVWSDINLVWLDLMAGRTTEAFTRLDAIAAGPELPPSLAMRVFSTAAQVNQRAGRHEAAVTAAEAAVAAVASDPDLDDAERDAMLMRLAWSFRPKRCDRVLAILRPIERRLEVNPTVAGDVLARLMATCAVRVGEDAAAPLARLASWWQRAQDPSIDPLVRLEIVNAHLEIFDVLGRDAEFAHWARELEALRVAGLDLDSLPLGHMPWITRARALVTAPPAGPGS